ncbi:hypothetical protein D3C86_1800310 [compost metagenome]
MRGQPPGVTVKLMLKTQRGQPLRQPLHLPAPPLGQVAVQPDAGRRREIRPRIAGAPQQGGVLGAQVVDGAFHRRGDHARRDA